MYDYSVAYCTSCKANVSLTEIKFLKLANNMAAVEGICTSCGLRLIKGKIMPKSGKNPLSKSKRKANKKKSAVYIYKNKL